MRLSKVSQIQGRGWESFFVREFYLLKLIQNLKEPSFFRTSTTALHQGLLLGQIAPVSSINLRCSLTSSTCGGGILLNHSLNGAASGSLSLIKCSAAFVRPMSFFSGRTSHGTPQGGFSPVWLLLHPKYPVQTDLISQKTFTASLPQTYVPSQMS